MKFLSMIPERPEVDRDKALSIALARLDKLVPEVWDPKIAIKIHREQQALRRSLGKVTRAH